MEENEYTDHNSLTSWHIVQKEDLLSASELEEQKQQLIDEIELLKSMLNPFQLRYQQSYAGSRAAVINTEDVNIIDLFIWAYLYKGNFYTTEFAPNSMQFESECTGSLSAKKIEEAQNTVETKFTKVRAMAISFGLDKKYIEVIDEAEKLIEWALIRTERKFESITDLVNPEIDELIGSEEYCKEFRRRSKIGLLEAMTKIEKHGISYSGGVHSFAQQFIDGVDIFDIYIWVYCYNGYVIQDKSNTNLYTFHSSCREDTITPESLEIVKMVFDKFERQLSELEVDPRDTSLFEQLKAKILGNINHRLKILEDNKNQTEEYHYLPKLKW